MNEAVLVRREGRVLVLVNNNPTARNAIAPGFYEGLAAGLAQADADPEIGAVVLTGAGGFFCAGGDLQQLAKRASCRPPAGASASKPCTTRSAPSALAASRSSRPSKAALQARACRSHWPATCS